MEPSPSSIGREQPCASASCHIRLWIASAVPGTAPHLLRADFDYLTPDSTTGMEIQPGSHGSTLYSLIDSVTVPERKEIHSHVLFGGRSAGGKDKTTQVDVERNYSRYRQFTSTVRVLPVKSPTPQ